MRNENPRLYPEDQKRVDQYLNQDLNRVHRQPFRPLWLMTGLLTAIVLLGLLSRLIGQLSLDIG